MFHDTRLCIKLWLCCNCKRIATWQISEKDILYLCICLNFLFSKIVELKKRVIDIHFAHILAFMCTGMNTYEALQLDLMTWIDLLVSCQASEAFLREKSPNAIHFPNANHLKSQSSAAEISSLRWFVSKICFPDFLSRKVTSISVL